MAQAPNDRKVQRLVRKLVQLAEGAKAAEFEIEVRKRPSRQLITGCRRAKILVRAHESVRDEIAAVLLDAAGQCLEAPALDEFKRYVSLSLFAASARENIGTKLEAEVARLPKLSKRQLVEVAMRLFRKALPDWPEFLEDDPVPETVAENARRLHAASGHSNDLAFAVARVLNTAWSRAGDIDLRRPDAMARASKPFREATRLASQLTALDYAFDSASFGHFVVTSHDSQAQIFQFDIADMRLHLIRIFAIRRRMTAILSGHRIDRFVREALAASGAGVVNNALMRSFARANRGPPEPDDFARLELVLKRLLLKIDANDDLLVAATQAEPRLQILYHMAIALRVNAAALKMTSQRMGPRARRSFDGRISMDELIADIADPNLEQAAHDALLLLTIEMPANSYWDILKTPFVRSSEGSAISLLFGDADSWTEHVRELFLKGGESGRKFGEIWEEFLAQRFGDTGWNTIARNIKFSSEGKALTEVDLLLLRGDLLLVVEIKALTGSGLNPYDHWKNRETIERGCRQAKLAARHLTEDPKLLASISNRRIAEAIKFIQPVVFTNEAMFDGWEYSEVPVVGESIRKAITEGAKVEYFDGHTKEPYRTDWYLRPEDLNTSTILRALRDPIELKIGPEHGEVVHHRVELSALTLLVPDHDIGSNHKIGP